MLVDSRTLRLSTSSGDSSASLKSGRARLGSERDRRRKYTRQERASLLVVAFLLSAVSYGSDLASGILYAKLLDTPCGGTHVRRENTSGFGQRASDDGHLSVYLANASLPTNAAELDERLLGPVRLDLEILAEGNASNESHVHRCGGFGKSASETGK